MILHSLLVLIRLGLGPRLDQGLYFVLVLTSGARDQGYPGIVHSALMLTRGARNEASPRIVLRTGAHQRSLGTRRAQGLYTPHWCSPWEAGMKLAQGLYFILALIVLIWRTSNSFYLRCLSVSSSSSVRQK